jgi:hypothetical protein
MRAFVLGAGASKAYADSPTGERMPIARDFFDIFDRLDLSANPWVLIGSIIGYVEDWMMAGSAYDYLRSGVDIEDLHSRIKADRDQILAAEGLVAATTPYKAYNELVFLFSAVINAIQNGPPSAAHLRLVESLSPDDVLITFNWDTLLDRALATATPWRPDWGYGVRPRCLFDDGWRDPERPRQTGNALIKLHGSTNWLTAYSRTDGRGHIVSGQDIDPGAFAVFERSTRPYACFKGRHMGGFEPYSFGYYPPNLPFPGRPAGEGRVLVRMTPRSPWTPEGTAPDDGLVSMPLIIPPVRNKSYEFFGELFKTLWSQAEDALAAADEITIIGYSFPSTDVQSDQLFRRAFSRRSSMPSVSILDPSPQPVATRISDLGIDADHLRIIDGRFSQDVDLTTLHPTRS